MEKRTGKEKRRYKGKNRLMDMGRRKGTIKEHEHNMKKINRYGKGEQENRRKNQ